MAFGLRLRVQSTIRLRAGENVEADHCLFINPEIPDIQVFLKPVGPAYLEGARVLL